MKLRIENFRGIAHGEYELSDSGVTLVTGPNGSGKTSLALAIASLLLGPAYVPLDFAKKDANLLLHNGAPEALLELIGLGGKKTVKWPSGKTTSEGFALEASEIALGLRSICDNTSDTQSGMRERAAMLSTVLSCEPKLEDLKAALTAEGLNYSDKNIQAVWGKLQLGDAGWTEIKNSGQRLKGEWQGITHQTWGSREGEGWLPEGWEPELAGASEETLAAACVAARQEVEALLQSSAVDDAERQRLTALVSSLGYMRAHISNLEQVVLDADKLMREARDKANVPRPEKSPAKGKPALGVIYKCAYTGKPERLANNTLQQVSEEPQQPDLTPSDYPLAVWQADQAALVIQQNRLDHARLDLERAKSKIAEAEAAGKKLAELPEPQDNTQQLEAARTAETLCQQRLKAWQAKTAASGVHKQILKTQAVTKVLSPEGVRATVLARELDKFNVELQHLSDISKWEPVKLGPDFLPYVKLTRDWPYRTLSRGEQFRVRVTLQLAIAKREKAPMVVIDDCDMLDKPGRQGLFAMLKKLGIPAVMAMMLLDEKEKPDLSKWGGKSYWMGL